jgi:hypothetical protein
MGASLEVELEKALLLRHELSPLRLGYHIHSRRILLGSRLGGGRFGDHTQTVRVYDLRRSVSLVFMGG